MTHLEHKRIKFLYIFVVDDFGMNSSHMFSLHPFFTCYCSWPRWKPTNMAPRITSLSVHSHKQDDFAWRKALKLLKKKTKYTIEYKKVSSHQALIWEQLWSGLNALLTEAWMFILQYGSHFGEATLLYFPTGKQNRKTDVLSI